ncbi:MAG TPA: PIN domain-containing protein [Candidatus Thermoplasmatota archaeon]|nr:PIN domain-containing protein [Candidatus Thermoplasmatota archaeon]
MARVQQFFFDTYALVERQSGNPAYSPFAAAAIFTHQYNVYEFIAAILRVADESRAREEVRLLGPNLVEAETDDLFAAARFRTEQVTKRVSYVDALGYVLAKKHGMRFLTGDKAFKGIDNVEFVP